MALALALSSAATAQSIPEAALRKAVAIVVARGVNETDSSPTESQATGFFINSMGLLVTSYHLREQLGANVNSGSVSYEVHFDPFAPPVPAKDVYSSAAADILILYVPISGRPVEVLKPADRATAKIELSRTPVYAASFAAGYDFSLTPAVITAWSGPVRPLIPAWTTNVNFAAGQSGSPLVLEDGRVVAIVKGAESSGAAIGIVVPILFIPTQYWDPQSSAVQALANIAQGAEPARVVVSKTVISSEPRQIVRAITLSRDACDPRVRQTVHVTASPGTRIDPGTVSLTVRSFTGKRLQSSGVSNVSANGLDVNAEIFAEGVCVRFFRGAAKGIVAKLEAELRYSEIPNSPVASEMIVAQAPAIGGIELPVGSSAKGLNFSIIGPAGNVKPFTPRHNELKTLKGQKILDVSMVLTNSL